MGALEAETPDYTCNKITPLYRKGNSLSRLGAGDLNAPAPLSSYVSQMKAGLLFTLHFRLQILVNPAVGGPVVDIVVPHDDFATVTLQPGPPTGK